MIQIDDFDGSRKGHCGQIPDPRCTVSLCDDLLRESGSASDRLGEDPETGQFLKVTTPLIECLFATHSGHETPQAGRERGEHDVQIAVFRRHPPLADLAVVVRTSDMNRGQDGLHLLAAIVDKPGFMSLAARDTGSTMAAVTVEQLLQEDACVNGCFRWLGGRKCS